MSTATLLLWYAGALLFGGLCGFGVGWLFGAIVKPGSNAAYFSSLSVNVKGLLFGDDKDFWPHYKAVMLDTAKYVGIQLAGVFVAFAPLVLVLLLLAPQLLGVWERDAPWVVIPATAGELGERSLVFADGAQIALPEPPGPVAVCSDGSLGCLVLSGFGFRTLASDTAAVRDGLVVIRATRDDWNPLWPYLSDPEFLFFLALTLVSVGQLVFSGRARRAPQASPRIGFMDNLLTQFAATNGDLLRRLGDLETRRLGGRLADIHIDRPVFIAGLARSGTTILLEKLATLPGVGTHQYRDFPFVMTPVYWNRYVRIAGRKQAKAERPHQDGIEITRDSPDAFEEPIWQHFFAGLHDPQRSHVLDADSADAEFEQFYREHLRKILLLRDAQRYLSKGNYNLPRIQYLASIFPDAKFIVPVRHPLRHIESLVRQQQLFVAYAEAEPNTPDYLRAVGHYEFGVQRQPINVNDSAVPTLAAWQTGREAAGYAAQWSAIYGFIAELLGNKSELAERVRIVRFEDLCAAPAQKFSELLEFTELGAAADAERLAQGIKPSAHPLRLDAAERDECWTIVGAVAQSYGYRLDPSVLDDFDASVWGD